MAKIESDDAPVVLMPDLPTLVANCGGIDRATAERFVEQHRDELVTTLKAGIVVWLARQGASP
jgi:hypothetical protein